MPGTMPILAFQIDQKNLTLPEGSRVYQRKWLLERGINASDWEIRQYRLWQKTGDVLHRPRRLLSAADVLDDDVPEDLTQSMEDGIEDPRATPISDEEAVLVAPKVGKGVVWKGSTVTVVDPATGQKSWPRIAPSAASQGPEYILRVPEAHQVTVNVTRHRTPSRLKTAVMYGDEQMGYWLDERNQWRTTHDEAAMDVVWQITREIQEQSGVDFVVNLGDRLDFAAFSKHRSSPSMLTMTGTNMAIQRSVDWDCAMTAITPDAERWMIKGNHDSRIVTWLMDNAPAVSSIRRATLPGEPDARPQLSLEELLRAGETGWQLSEDYPEGRVYLSDRSKCIHGNCAKPRHSQNSEKYLAEAEEDTFSGHTHRSGIYHRVVRHRYGTRKFVAANPGCLCRTDGVVPSSQGGHRATGTPTRAWQERWDQGMLVVKFDPADPDFCPLVELVTITDGVGYYRDMVFEARCDVDGYDPQQLADRVALIA